MTRLAHPIWGSVDLAAPGLWQGELSYAGSSVSVELTLDAAGLSASSVESLPTSPTDLEPLDKAARALILSDAKSRDEDCASIIYLLHHAEVLSPEHYRRLFGVSTPDLDHPEPLLARLRLVRVALYPEHKERKIVLDYSIDPDFTHYLLCISFDANGVAVALELES